MENSLARISELANNISEVAGSIIRYNLGQDVILDEFKKSKKKHYNELLDNSIKELAKLSAGIDTELKKYHELVRIRELVNAITKDKGTHNHLDLLEAVKELKKALPQQKKSEALELKKLPDTIHTEIIVDLEESKKCFEAGCYRSATIMCGRVLETCLYRKYFELTQKDILETCPEMGLGKLIAKLSELSVKFDPGLTEQIHLINKARISSVHKKQQTFMPTKSQAQAIMLFTVDIINKLFG